MRKALPLLFMLAGCGGESGDLMAIEISGGVAQGGALEIVVTDNGQGTCNGGGEQIIPSELLIETREIERDLGDLAEEGATYEPTGDDRREYVVRTKAGTVRWAEGERGLPEVLPRAQLLALRLDRTLCRS